MGHRPHLIHEILFGFTAIHDVQDRGGFPPGVRDADGTGKTIHAMNNKVYASLVRLCVDICLRYGKTKLIWFGDKNKSLAYKPKDNEMILTVHRWFAQKSCPGDWLYSRLGKLADQVTKELEGAEPTSDEKPEKTGQLYRVQCGAFSKIENAEKRVRNLKAAGFDAVIMEE